MSARTTLLAVLVLSAMLAVASAQDAGLEDKQTAVSGTDEADIIEVAESKDATATIGTQSGGELTAKATGVDAKAGDDTVSGAITVTTSATATANLLALPDPTKANATALGVDAGDGDDHVSGALAFTSTATATGVYAGSIEYLPESSVPPPKEIDVSISTTADATGIVSGDGADSATNDALFAVTSLATSGGTANQFNATVRDSVSLKNKSESKAAARAVHTGAGADTVTNNGVVSNIATATSGALAIGLVAPKDTSKPSESQKTQIKTDATAKAEASSTGIDTEDEETEDSSEDSSPYDVNGLRVTYHKTVSTVSADDTVENGVALVNAAIATSGAGSGAVSNKVDGTVDATATSEASAEGVAITTGGGDDRVINRGELLSNATANAGALSVSIEVGQPSEPAPAPPPGEKPKPAKPAKDKENKSKTKTDVTAKARATGIDAEGSGTTETTDGYVELANGALTANYHSEKGGLAGDDNVENHGAIQAIASANSGSSNASVLQSSGGSTSAESKSTASTYAAGVTTGGGNDRVTSAGALTVSATSDASAIGLGLAVGVQPAEGETKETTNKVAASSETKVESEAEAIGVHTAGTSTATETRHLELRTTGLKLNFGESSSAGADDDRVENLGIMTTTATANSGAADAAITLEAAGSVTSDASSNAKATSTGVSTGAGNDVVINDFLFTAQANASADSLSLAITAAKPATEGSSEAPDKTSAQVKAGSTAEAVTRGIDTEGTAHDTSKSTAITISGNGLEVIRTSSDTSQAGSDRVTNHGAMLVGADAASGTIAAGITIGGEGTVGADATSKAQASSLAIHTGGGADVIENHGLLTNDATADAYSLALGISVAQPAKSSEGEPPTAAQLDKIFATTKATANADATTRATGIDADGTTHSRQTTDTYRVGLQGLTVQFIDNSGSMSGDDQVSNSGGLTSTSAAFAGAGSVAASFESEGTAATEAKANASATANGMLTGGGSDEVTNSGVLLSTATATSGAISGSLVVGAQSPSPSPAPAPAPSPTPAKPTPKPASKDKESKATSDTSVSAAARATGVDTEGTGHTQNSETNFSLTFAGLHVSKVTSSTAAAGDDQVTNTGAITASGVAEATTRDAGIAISSGGSTQADSKANASSYGAAIATGAGADDVVNSGLVTSSATSTASAVSLALNVGQAQETTPPASTTPPSSAPSKLATSTETSVTANADAFGIDAEGKNTQTASTRTLDIDASGLHYNYEDSNGSGAGNDRVLNNAILTTNSRATADSTGAAIALDAAGSVNAETQTQSRAASTGIYTGGGDDTVENNFLLDSNAEAHADSIALTLSAKKPPEKSANTPTPAGAKKDKTNVKVDAQATAKATATGIDAEGAEHEKSRTRTLQIDGNAQQITFANSDASQAGSDIVTNRGDIDVDADATSGALSAGITIGAAGSVDVDTTSKAEATGAAILTGGGADTVTNSFRLRGDADATATALAAAVSVSQPTNGSGTKPSTLDGMREVFATAHSIANAEATAASIGIDTEGGAYSQEDSLTIGNSGDGRLASLTSSRTTLGGSDVVRNDGVVTVTAGALTLAGAAEVRVETEGTASSEANAISRSTTGGVLTGAGSDDVINRGILTTTSTATSGTLAVSFSQSGAAGTKAKSDARSSSEARSVGIGTGAEEANRERELALTLSLDGIQLTYTDDISADDGADTIANEGALNSTSIATAGAAGAAIAIDGSASTDVTANAKAQAGGIDAGGGDDDIVNDGLLGTSAVSTSDALALAFGQKGDEKAASQDKVHATAIADASAAGISADSGADSSIDATLTIGFEGLTAHLGYENNAATGNDEILNRGGIGVVALATGGAQGAAVAIDGVAKADVDAIARSRATGIDGGGGDDAVRNEGALLVDATSSAGALAATVGSKTSSDSKARTRVDTSSTATAVSVGIATDGGGRDEAITTDLAIGTAGLSFDFATSSTAVTGDDTLDNRNTVIALSHANSGAASVAVTVKGAANAISNSTANATALALDTGGGADQVFNSGYLEAQAAANAATLNAAISTEGRAISNAGFMGAGTTAKARAIGISTTGQEENYTTELSEDIDFNDIGITFRLEFATDSLAGDGADVVDNRGEIFARSTADAPRVNAAVTGKGVAVSMGKASSDSYVSGIDSGDLDDVIDNTGKITAETEANAILANVAVSGKGLAVAANAVWDGGTEATAAAHGINADGGERTTTVITAEANTDLARVRYNKDVVAARGDDVIRNSGEVSSHATATAPSLNVGVVTGGGVSVAVSTATSNADSTALRGGDGDDTIENSGQLTTISDATAATANLTFTNQGVAIAADAVWDGGTKATATSSGIAADGGDRSKSSFVAVGTDQTTRENTGVLADGSDTILNSGAIDSAANAWALSVSAAVTMTGVGAATATSTATSTATAIDAGDGVLVDNVSNSGHLKATANSEANAASVSVVNSGAALSADSVWDGGTKANAYARGIDVGAGGELVTNTGAIEADAEADTKAAAASVAVSGVAGAIATSTATSEATAIDASAGDDTDQVVNAGALTVTTESDAITASVAFSNAGLAIAADAVWDGGTTSTTRARGIDVGNVADVVDNDGAIDVTGDAYAKSLSASITVNGVAGAMATSTSRADAAGIDAGDDNARDVVTNSATLSAKSYGESATSSIGFVMAGVALASDTPWDGGTGADAISRGIRVGSGSDDILNSGAVTADAHSVAVSASISVAVVGVAGAMAKSTSTADAVALDAGVGTGDDLVENTGHLNATAKADAASASVGFTTAGVAAAFDGGTSAKSTAKGVELGEGLDTMSNAGYIESHSDAIATGTSVSFALEGLAVAVSSANADSHAFGIDGATGDDEIQNTADIWADSLADANAVSASGTKFGVAGAGVDAWDGGATSMSRADAISGGSGQDEIINTGHLTSDARAASPSIAASITVAGAAASISTATSTAEAQAISAGDDADIIENRGKLSVTADSDAVAVSVALVGGGVAVAADSVWDGGTTARANASGIAGGNGNDVIANRGTDATIDSSAMADARSISVSITGGGYAASTSTSTAIADGAAIDGGSGNDIIYNESGITGKAEADAKSASISVAVSGAAVATDAFWDGGTKANADAAGIAGGDGNDEIVNAGSATAIADSETTSAAVAATLSPSFGLTFAAAASTSTAEATALEAGAGDDELSNAGDLRAQSDANADGVSFSFTPVGAALAGGFDAKTRADATVTGMSGAAGGDTLVNGVDATLTLDGSAQTRNLAAALTLAGVASANANAEAQSRGTGLAGGAGEDSLYNDGVISGEIDARSASTAVTALAMGAGLVSANSTAQASGAGLAGGLDDDDVTNSGVIELAFNAEARGQSISVVQSGFALSEASAESTVDALGLGGDAGEDTLINSGRLHIEAGALTTARAIGGGQFGYTVAAANSIARAASSGMAGGSEDDTLINEASGVVDVSASARVNATSASVVVGGATEAEARTQSFVEATGLSGGDGADTILNAGSITVGPEASDAWMSFLNTQALSVSFAGAAEAQSAASASTRATGIDGGAEGDRIRNEGDIAVKANARSSIVAGTLNIFGSGSSGGESGAMTHATGIAGGDGDDGVESLGTLSVWAESNLYRSGVAYTFGGSSETGSTLGALTNANGIAGGAGVDRIGNGGVLTVDAHSVMFSKGDAETTFGAASDSITSGAVTRAFGLSGGDADDILENRAGARLQINATADVTAESSAYNFFGSGPSTGAVLTGDVGATGFAGDAGNDILVNRGDVAIQTDASLASTGGASMSVTIAGDTHSSGTSDVVAKAAGFEGADGDDFIGTYGTLAVEATGTAEASNDASTGGFSVVNDNEAGAVTRANVAAIGIDAGAGANGAEIDGTMSVDARGIAYSLALSSGPTFTASGGGTSKTNSSATATATGVTGLDGNDDVSNEGDITVNAHATTAKAVTVKVTVLRDIRETEQDQELAAPEVIDEAELPPMGTQYSPGTVVFWTQSPVCEEEDQRNCGHDPNNPEGTEGGHFQVQLKTVYPENEEEEPYEELQWVWLEDGLYEPVIIEQLHDSFPSYAAANGSGVAGSGNARSTGTATATARGVVLQAGDNRFVNGGTLQVIAEAEGVAHVAADGDGFGNADGVATANATASAIGIELGDGNDLVANRGTLEVRATPIAQARAEASGGDICIWFFGWWCGGGGTGVANAYTTVSGEASGILAGGGDNVIVNDGDIHVASRPEIRDDPRTGEYVGAVTQQNQGVVRLTLTSRAVGIETGDGNDEIENNGSLRVEAWDVRSACDASSCGGEAPYAATLEARGIVTGAGNDIVRNDGALAVETIVDNQRTHALGIDTGAGDDELSLGDGSSIIGTVSLGDGDDTLLLRGTPTITNSAGVLLNVDAGAGSDTLVLDGAGAYAGTPLSIERAAKFGEGLYTLPTLGGVEQLTTDAGTLHLESGYEFAADGAFDTVIHTDGRSALFSASGDVALAGTFEVERRGDTFVADGTRFTVVQGDTISGEFADAQLPQARRLLSYELEVLPDAVDVVAHSASFTTVTDNPLYRDLATNLDAVTRDRDADLNDLFGTMQNMDGDFDRAFASFSPESTLATADSMFTNLREMTRVLRSHLGETRVRYRHAPHAATPETALSFTGGSGGLGTLRLGAAGSALGYAELPAAPPPPQFPTNRAPRSQVWMLGIGAESENDAIAGYTAFDTETEGFLLGGDRRVGEDWLLGLTVGKTKTDVVTGELATGDIESWQASMYATWFDERYHFEAGAAYGEQDFKDSRALVVGSVQRQANSEHDGDALNVFAGGGVSFGNERWSIEPFVSFNYISATEEAFEETGAAGMNLLVPARDTRALFGEAGAAFAVRQPLGSALIDWHATLAVGYDFGIDDGTLFYSYAGAPLNVFSIDGRPADDTSALYGVGVSLLGERSALSIDFQGARNSDRVEKYLSARVVVRF